MTIKLSTLNQFNRDMKGLNSEVRASFQKASSLKAYENFQQLSSLGAAEKVTTMDTTIANHELFGELVRDAGQTMQFIDMQLKNLVEQSEIHLSNMVTLRSSSGKNMNYPTLAQNFLANIANILNANINDKYVFSGEDYITVPVPDITKSNLIEGIPTSNYYQGGGATLSVTINELKTKIEYGINADNDAFQEIISGVHLSLTSFDGNRFINDSAVLDQAFNLVRSGLTKIIELRSKLGNDWSIIAQNIDSRKDGKDFWKEGKDEISGIDVVDAKKELGQRLANLESSYSALNKVNSVRLLDYLK